jgi:hypothetical protein
LRIAYIIGYQYKSGQDATTKDSTYAVLDS